MLLNRKESSCQATMNFKSNETFVKENHHLARGRSTAYTQIAFNPNVVLPLKFVLEGIGKCPPKSSPPNRVKFYWAPKDSYRLELLLETIKNLPNRFNMFSRAIHVLHDHAVYSSASGSLEKGLYNGYYWWGNYWNYACK